MAFLVRRQIGDTIIQIDNDLGRWGFAAGRAFPTAGDGLPLPHDGALFFRLDLNANYVWDEPTRTWIVVGGGAGGPHAADHQNGGGDEITVVGLSGLLADGQTPLAHAASHQNGGADEIDLTGLSGFPASTRVIGITIDGGGVAISTGVKGYISIPFAGTISAWVLTADVSGSIVIDVWKDTYANFPPTVADTIAGTELPTLTAVQKNADAALSTWTTAISAGDVIGFNVNSAATVTRVTLVITVTVAA